MTSTLAQIWRHPIKAHGYEALDATPILAGQTMPWDRAWAVTHEASKVTSGAWALCANFTRGAGTPGLMAVRSKLDEATETVTLSHPDLEDLTFQPDTGADVDRFLDWVAPLMIPGRAAPTGILRATEGGLTDSASRSVSLGNLATLRALEELTGQKLDTKRFRLNLWVDGLPPYGELDWLDKPVRIGDVAFHVRDHAIERCASIKASADTGRRDADPLAVMREHWGREEFGLTLIAETTGTIAIGDSVTEP